MGMSNIFSEVNLCLDSVQETLQVKMQFPRVGWVCEDSVLRGVLLKAS